MLICAEHNHSYVYHNNQKHDFVYHGNQLFIMINILFTMITWLSG